jgi:hypothetical protein
MTMLWTRPGGIGVAKSRVGEQGPSLRISRAAHNYLDRLNEEEHLSKAAAASAIIEWVAGLEEPRSSDLIIRRLIKSDRRDEAARAVIAAIKHQYLGED